MDSEEEDSDGEVEEVGNGPKIDPNNSSGSFNEDLDQVNPINEHQMNIVPLLNQPFEKLSSCTKSHQGICGNQDGSLQQNNAGKYSTPFSSASVVKAENEEVVGAAEDGRVGNS